LEPQPKKKLFTARSVFRFPWCAASPFSAMLRPILGVQYLWDDPLVLDGSKLR
jgi:hypothetical protein